MEQAHRSEHQASDPSPTGPQHTLLLLRHAQAEDFAPGRRDHDRRLTEAGVEQATAVGDAIRSRALRIDHALCSSATRTRQTWNALAIDAGVEVTDEVYNAGGDPLLKLVRLLDEEVNTAMIIGHAPGIPWVAARLAGGDSDQRGLDIVNSRYPTATLSSFTVTGPWADLEVGRLDWVRLGV